MQDDVFKLLVNQLPVGSCQIEWGRNSQIVSLSNRDGFGLCVGVYWNRVQLRRLIEALEEES